MSRRSSTHDIPSSAAWCAFSITQLAPGPDASSSRTGGETRSGGELAMNATRMAASSRSSDHVACDTGSTSGTDGNSHL
jgi:hypothetical protein